MNDEKGRQPSDKDGQEYVGYLIVVLFFSLVFWFLIGPELGDIPARGEELVAVEGFSTDPLFTMLDDPPSALMGGYELKCVECHKLFPSLPETARNLTQHTHITLDHGLNNRCFNCHDYGQRDRLGLPGGRTIPFADVALLCATCHGTTYRDWQRGIHGRTSGYWNPRYGEQIRLTCSQCHNPHQPAYEPMSVLPGPDTLRMGDPGSVEHQITEEDHNPLRLPATKEHGSNHSSPEETP